MTIRDLVIRNRSYRRFATDKRISRGQLLEWLDMARQTASARNMQPLKYAVVNDLDTADRVFEQLKWAGYLPDWNPVQAEQPAAYVVFCCDKTLASATPQIDLGIQAQTLLLAATEAGYGGCILLAFNKEKVAEVLSLPDTLMPALVVALGVPTEKCVIEPVKENGDIRYYRDAEGVHHVPKRPLDELVI